MEALEQVHPTSWYPICLSGDIQKKALKPILFNGIDWLLFRGADGRLGMVSRFCPHMGTDLANGTVKGNCVSCPLHGWQFDSNGACTKMPPSNLQPAQVTTGRLVVEEKYGIVFAFWGEKPLFEIPQFTGISDPACSAPFVYPLQNPYVAVSLNGFDTWHYYNVHNRTVLDGYRIFSNGTFHIAIALEIGLIVKRWYDHVIKCIGLTKSAIQLDYYGGNLIMVRNNMTGHCAFLALLPNEGNKTTTLFFVVALPKPDSIALRVLMKPKLWFLRFMSFSFLKPDFPIQKNMRPVRGLLTSKDESAAAFWDYWEKLPRYPSGTHI